MPLVILVHHLPVYQSFHVIDIYITSDKKYRQVDKIESIYLFLNITAECAISFGEQW